MTNILLAGLIIMTLTLIIKFDGRSNTYAGDPSGRYQISAGESTAFVIDTYTGEIFYIRPMAKSLGNGSGIEKIGTVQQ